MDSRWREGAVCVGAPWEDFFPKYNERNIDFFRRVRRRGGRLSCPSTCPVMAECAADALLHDDRGGVRAGIFFPDKGFKTRKEKADLRILVEIAKPVLTPIQYQYFLSPRKFGFNREVLHHG